MYNLNLCKLTINMKHEIFREIFEKKITHSYKNFDIYNVAFFEKDKEKHLEISLFYTCAPKILILSHF